MSQSQMVLRVQSSDGTKRIEVNVDSTLQDLHESIFEAFNLTDYDFGIYKERNFTCELVSSSSQKLKDCNLRHGDMLYMKLTAGMSSKSKEAQPSTSKNSSDELVKPKLAATVPVQIKEDDVDLMLYKVDGRIPRNREDKLCRHNPNGCCVHCSPYEPWDESYLKEHNIKHLSFHAYIRKLTSGVDRGKYAPLEDLNCRIKSGCRDHLPWPKGICSKCQPSAVTLNRQSYRHVDNVMFENTALVERFLNYWRKCGHQRMGFLYGTYEMHPDVPLGIRATVAAIYEPPQQSSRDSIQLLPDDHIGEVDDIAAALGLRKVGWIFTDLLSDDSAAGTVKQVRGIETHFLTAAECIMAGHLQNQNPNYSKHSSNGTFGSKFVTVCVTGDSKKQVHMEGYAVSAQCMAMVRDNCLVPTKDAPELGYVRESNDKQYVPDAYYKEKDSYGNEVSRLGRPLPVEYLLVDVPASTPLTPLHTFSAYGERKPFPIANRFLDGHLQDFAALTSYLAQWTADEFLEAISDFHLLIYLSRTDMLPIKSTMGPLLEAVHTKNREMAIEWREQEVWRTLEQLIDASTAPATFADNNDRMMAANDDPEWTCTHCTFINRRELATCDICRLPRNSE